ncbi:MAG: paraslipin [Deltaproteobacteria bacterium]|nr:paraslipin [Deltaproteobacteria bacterium]
MSFGLLLGTVLTAVLFLALVKGIRTVPQNSSWVVERFGRYRTTLNGGLNIIIPFVDKVAYKWDLRELVRDVPAQQATTKDNIRVEIDGVLYCQMVDPKLASYGSSDPLRAVVELAQTTMRAQIGRMDLDDTLSKRDDINDVVVDEVNAAAVPWGILVKRYEINDIVPPLDMQEDMKKQARAERERREAETGAIADRNARVTRARGLKEEAEQLSEGERIKRENEAAGAARAVELAAQASANARLMEAKAEAEALELVGRAASTSAGQSAIAFRLAGQAIDAQAAIAKKSTIVLKDGGGAGTAGDTVAEALAVAAAMNTSFGTHVHELSTTGSVPAVFNGR